MINLLLRFIEEYPLNTLSIFLTVFFLFLTSAYIGKFFSRKKTLDDKVGDDEAKIILGAILSLLGLFTGFILNVAISGYNLRQSAEENETIGIGKAYQYSTLLPTEDSLKAKKTIVEYLEARINFFNSGYTSNHAFWQELSFEKQNELWKIGMNNVKQKETAVTTAILNSYSDLYINQEKTMIGWQEQVPSATWVLLLLFAVTSNLLVGYNIRGIQGKNWMMHILPFLMAISLFIIAEIDVPGEGVIHVSSKNLEALKQRILIQN